MLDQLHLTLHNATAFEDVIGSAFADEIQGNTRMNLLEGRAGNDTLWGFAANDTLIGGTGDDVAFGGTGNDYSRVTPTTMCCWVKKAMTRSLATTAMMW